jgi:hypothetical protein
MANCATSNNLGAVTIPSDTAINCKLRNPPNGITIVEAKVFQPSNSSSGTACTLTGTQSFTIPKLQKGTARLFVSIQGPFDETNPIFVVEDCDQQTVIMAITDADGLASKDLGVS